MPLRCKFFARLNNCANCDEADVSFVQTQKKRKVSILYLETAGLFWLYHYQYTCNGYLQLISQRGQSPQVWKDATISPILKESPGTMSKLRPISSTAHLAIKSLWGACFQVGPWGQAWLPSSIWVGTCRLTAWLVGTVAVCKCLTVWKGLVFQKKTLSLCLFHMFAQWLNMPPQFGMVVLLKSNPIIFGTKFNSYTEALDLTGLQTLSNSVFSSVPSLF